MRPTRASPISRLSTSTNCIRPVPVAPATSTLVVDPVIRTPAAWSARGLISVLSDPVSSMSFASALPLTRTSTRMR
jgi:hypothetical protein